MARVPLMVVPQAEQSQLPGPMADDRAPLRRMDGGGQEVQQLGQSLMRAGTDYDRLAAQQQALTNESTVKDSTAQLHDMVSKLMYDPETGYMNAKGKNALGAAEGGRFDDVHDALQNAVRDLGGKLTNPEQQRMFGQVAQQVTGAAVNAMRQHASQQNTVYAMDSSRARGDAAGESAVLAFNPMPGADNSLYQQGVAVRTAELRDQARLAGLDADSAAGFVKAGLAKTYTSVLDHLLANGQTKAANDYFGSVRDQLPSQVADKITAALTAGRAKDDGINLALTLGQKFGTLAQQEAELNKRKLAGDVDADTYTVAQAQLRAGDAMRKSAQADAEKQFLGSIWDAHRQNPAMTVANLTPQQLAFVKASNLGPHVDNILRPDTAPKIDDIETVVQLRHMAADDPVGFVHLDLHKFGLNPSSLLDLSAKQDGITKKGAIQLSVDKLMSGAVRTAVGELKVAGVDPGAKPGTDAAQNYADFQNAAFNALEDEVKARQASKLKPMTDADARAVVLGVVKKTTLAGTGVLGFFQDDGPAYQVVSKIPAADREQITQALRAKGRAVTPAAIVDLYNAVRAKPAVKPATGAQGSW